MFPPEDKNESDGTKFLNWGDSVGDKGGKSLVALVTLFKSFRGTFLCI